MSQNPPSEGVPSDRQPGGAVGNRAAPTADVVFGLLATATNRYVLEHLIDCDREVTVNELVEYAVAVTEADPDETVGEFRGSVRVSVERSVAELESHGFLRHDGTTGTIEATDRTAVAEPYLSLAREGLAAPDT